MYVQFERSRIPTTTRSNYKISWYIDRFQSSVSSSVLHLFHHLARLRMHTAIVCNLHWCGSTKSISIQRSLIPEDASCVVRFPKIDFLYHNVKYKLEYVYVFVGLSIDIYIHRIWLSCFSKYHWSPACRIQIHGILNIYQIDANFAGLDIQVLQLTL